MTNLDERRSAAAPVGQPREPLRGEVIDGGSAVGFERMQALLRGGYVPQAGERMIDSSIQLDHPGKAPSLRLFPDGRIQVLDRSFPIHPTTGRDPFSIQSDDERSFGAFARFLEGVPQKKRRRGWRRFLVLTMIVGFWIFSIILTLSIGDSM